MKIVMGSVVKKCVGEFGDYNTKSYWGLDTSDMV